MLGFEGQVGDLAQKGSFERLLDDMSRIEWVVYAKKPFGGPRQVLKYLARYTHRVAISNHRLLELKDGRVTFSYKDYAAGNVTKTMTLPVCEFTRRFLLHVLPRGFVRIRHYGVLANRSRQQKLEQCRRLLTAPAPQITTCDVARTELDLQAETNCPACGQGRMVIVGNLDLLNPAYSRPAGQVLTTDTS
jgi:hypothetical protein